MVFRLEVSPYLPKLATGTKSDANFAKSYFRLRSIRELWLSEEAD
jgi:hypothetical protein